MAALQDVENVLNDGAARRGDDADAAGQGRKGLLALRGEESLGRQLCLELLEGDLHGPGAHRFHVFGEQLHFAARLVHGDAAAGDDLHAILRTKAQQARLGAKHHKAKLRVAVLQGEIDVATLGGAVVGDFSFDPDVGKTLLKMGADGGHQFAHTVDAARRCFGGKLEGELRIAHLGSLAGVRRGAQFGGARLPAPTRGHSFCSGCGRRLNCDQNGPQSSIQG